MGTKCTMHRHRTLDLFCEECLCILCEECHDEQHSSCNIVQVSTMILRVLPALQEGIRQLQDEVKDAEMINSKTRVVMERLTLSLNTADDALSRHIQDIKLLEEEATALRGTLKKARDEEYGRLKRETSCGEMVITQMNKLMELINQTLASDDVHAILGAYKQYSEYLNKSKLYMAVTKKIPLVGVEFAPRIYSYPGTSSGRIGEIFFTYEQIGHSGYMMSKSIDIKTGYDKYPPFLDDIVVITILNEDIIVVSDSANHSIKSFFFIGTLVYHFIQLNNPPKNLTKLKSNEIAVAVPKSKEILVFLVTPHLQLKRKLSVCKAYWGLTSLGPNKFAGGADGCVDILSSTGSIIRSIHTGAKRVPLFQHPYFLSTIRNHTVVVSDLGTKTVTFITQSGDVIAYKDSANSREIHLPLGVSSNNDDDVFVVDRNAKTLLQFSITGNYVRDVLTSADGVKCPRTVYVGISSTIYLSHEDRYVQMYQIVD